MEIILDLYSSIFPYLLCIPLGYWLQKKSILPKSWLTNPMIYALMPVLVIHHFLEADPVKLTILPFFSFFLSLAMIIPAKLAAKTFAEKYDLNLLKCSFSFFNVAFFGIPIVTALFGKEAVTILICIYVGSALYGDIIGYYQMARAKNSQKEALKNIFKVPFVYAFLTALVLKITDFESPDAIESVANVFGIMVSVGGMLMIGGNLTSLKLKGVDWPFVKKATGLRAISAILIMGMFLLLEYLILDRLEEEDRQMLALVALFPVAANVTVFASFFGSEEENSALLVLVTLLVSLVLVSVAALWL